MDILVNIVINVLAWSGIWFSEYEDPKKQSVQSVLWVITYTIILILIQVLALNAEAIHLYYIFGGIWLGLHIMPSSLLVLTSPRASYKKAYGATMGIIALVTVVITLITIFIS